MDNFELGLRIGRIEQRSKEMDELCALMGPLAKHLIPIRRDMNRQRLPMSGRTIELNKNAWPKQYKKGINRCMGFDIHWRGEEL